MTLKVCIRDRIERSNPHGGIGRVIHAQHKYLKNYDIEVVPEVDQANVLAGHTQQFEFPVHYDAPPFVIHIHGAYWTGEEGIYGNFATKANQAIANSIRRADFITVTAKWVSEFIERDMRIEPMVIGHGVELDEWSPAENEEYVFWAKNRPTDSCSPEWAYRMAERGITVVSTFMPEGSPRIEKYLKVMGFLQPEIMKDRMQHAGMYLATTKETFGITTLEALACGVPVLGFDWGGTKDIVRHKVDGYLAKPNNFEDLLAGYEYIRAHRKELSQNALERVKDYTWDKVMSKYAELYYRAYREGQDKKSGVSVVITSYNYKQYIGEAIDSVCAQTYPPEEIIVVDDGSTDGTKEYLMDRYGYRDPKTEGFIKNLKFISQSNQGVAAARNNGIQAATQPFVMCLDADDRLAPTYVEQCRKKLLTDKGIGIVYTGLVFFNDTTPPNPKQVQLTPFDFNLQVKGGIVPSTCIPCAAMFRKSMWERAGGYKQRYAPAEDTEFWVRGMMTGYTVDVASKEGLFYYRGHPNGASHKLKYHGIEDDKPYFVDRQYPFAAPSPQMPIVRSYSEPVVSIGIEVKSGQEYNVPDAIDSVLGQAIREWEIILYGKPVPKEILKAYPFVKLNQSPRANLWLTFDAAHLLQKNALEFLAVSLINGRFPLPAEVFKNPNGTEDMSHCCGGNGDSVVEAKRMLGMLPKEPATPIARDGKVKMMFISDRRGRVGYSPNVHNPGGKDIYFGANNDADRIIYAKPEHVDWLRNTGVFVVVPETKVIERPVERNDIQVDQGKPMYPIEPPVVPVTVEVVEPVKVAEIPVEAPVLQKNIPIKPIHRKKHGKSR